MDQNFSDSTGSVSATASNQSNDNYPSTEYVPANPDQDNYPSTEYLGVSNPQPEVQDSFQNQANLSARTELLNTAPPTFAWLVILEGMRAGKIYQLSSEGTMIGRDPSYCDIIIDDSSISRQHAKIRILKNSEGEDEFVLQDLATANGTKLNSQDIVKEVLKDNDRIEIGQTILAFKQVE